MRYILSKISLFSLLLCTVASTLQGSDTQYSSICHGPILIMDLKNIYRGCEVCNLALYKHLLLAGVDAHILVRRNSKLQKELATQGLPYHCPAENTDILITASLKNVILKNGIKLIHCSSFEETRWAYSIANETGLKIVFTNHMGGVSRSLDLSKVNGAIYVNPQAAQETAQSYEGMSDYIVWIPPFFEEQSFRDAKAADDRVIFYDEHFGITIKEGVPIITSIGRVDFNKNQVLIVRAMAILKKRGIETQAIFVGGCSTNMHRLIMSVVLDCGLEDNIHFVGYSNLVPDILANADINVLASLSEGLGIALIEGAIMGLPSICTNLPGPRSVIINGETGLVVEPNDELALANALGLYCTDAEVAKQLGEALYERFEKHFSTRVVLGCIIAFYNRVLES